MPKCKQCVIYEKLVKVLEEEIETLEDRIEDLCEELAGEDI